MPRYGPEWDGRRARRSVRLPHRAYSQGGAYFITICTHDRRCIFGRVVGEGVALSPYGEIVQQEWLRTAELRPAVTLGEFSVMPNHFHAILTMAGQGCDAANKPEKQAPFHRDADSVGSLVGGFKGAATSAINDRRHTPGASVWQRGYHEHVIRSDESLAAITAYIRLNPSQWGQDPENPDLPAGVRPAAPPWDGKPKP